MLRRTMRFFLRLPLVLLVAIAAAQAPTPITSHVLVAGKLPPSHDWSLISKAAPPSTLLAMSSDRSIVFVLIPEENRRWELQTLTGWETPAPSIQKVSFDGDESLDNADYMTASMTPAPDGNTMLVRIFVYNLHAYQRSAVVLLIDVQKSQVLWRRVTSDPLVANSRWLFSSTGSLIAAEGLSPSTPLVDHRVRLDIFDMDPTDVGDHKAALLSLPDLTPSLSCNYSVMNSDLPRREAQLKYDQCEDFFTQAGIKSIFELSKPPDGRTSLPYASKTGCKLQSLSTGGKHHLFTCYAGTDHKGYLYIKSRVERIYSDTGSIVLEVPVHAYEPISSTLGTLSGRDYFLLLRELKLEVYALP